MYYYHKNRELHEKHKMRVSISYILCIIYQEFGIFKHYNEFRD